MFSSLIEVIRMLTLFRTVWIAGRFGGGKTSLAVWLAIQMVEQKYASCICSNVPFQIGIEPVILDIEQAKRLENVVLLIDEAWLEMAQGADAKKVGSWLAYLRKANQYLILPSVRDLAKDLRYFTIERSWNFSNAGIPLWWYNWRLSTGGMTKRKETTGQFWITNPSRIFKLYDHNYRPSDRYYYYSTVPTTADSNASILLENKRERK